MPDVANNAGGDTVVFNGDFDAEIDLESLGAFFSTDPGIPGVELETEGIILRKVIMTTMLCYRCGIVVFNRKVLGP